MSAPTPSTVTDPVRPHPPSRIGRVARLALAGVALLGLVGCSVQPPAPLSPDPVPSDPVEVAQAAVNAKQAALEAAQTEVDAAANAFCSSGESYIAALDRYGDVIVQTAPTVGDVRAAGADLTSPREETLAAAEAVRTAADQVVTAEQELAAAEVALAEAEAAASGQTPAPAPTASPTSSPLAVPPSANRVRQAESDFAATQSGITDETPLREATVEFNAAVVALEMAWLQLFADAGCLASEQQEQAVSAVRDYTTALQADLSDIGLYDGDVDGVYGPMTVAAVKALQEAHDLPQTGFVDKATELALRAELAAKGLADAQQSIASTAGVQQLLKLFGYWDGDVDGVWTDELTEALKEFQTDLGVPATGEVDAATIAAFQKALEDLTGGSVTPTPSPSPTPTPSPESPSPSPTG